MNKTLLAGLAVGAMMLGVAGEAGATIIQTDVGLSNPATTIHFDEFGLVDGTPVNTQYASMGATFSPDLVQSPQASGYPHTDDKNLGNFIVGFGFTPFFINFVNDQSSAAFAYVANEGSSIFTTYKDGAVIEIAAFSTTPYSNHNWYVFSGYTFDSIMVDVGGSSQVMLLDNLQLGTNPVPEPTTILLLGAGLAGLAAARRRKKAC